MSNHYNDLWNNVLEVLRAQYDDELYNDTFLPCNQLYKFDKNTFYVRVPTEFHKARIEQFYIKRIIENIQKVTGHNYDVKFVTDEYIKNDETIPISEPDPQFLKLYRGNLKATYSFDNYVVGPSNRLAYMLSLQIAERPGLVANPLYIFGGVGLGKTHLMQAIGNFALDNNPQTRVLYVKTEKFIEDFVQIVVREKKDLEFKTKYRDIDILLIDDIQFLAGKERSQLEFFKIFEELHNMNKQIVITSDRPALELKDMMDRLTSRFEWGMQADIKYPDFNTRLDILKKKMASERMDFESIPPEIVEYIATKFSTNIRKLEGALKRVLFYATMNNEEYSIELAKEALASILPENNVENNFEISNIQRVVAEYYRVPVEMLSSKSRKKEFVYPRQIAMYLTRTLTNHSFPKIGKDFGNRDHTTVMHAIDKINKHLEFDVNLKKDIDKLIKKLK